MTLSILIEAFMNMADIADLKLISFSPQNWGTLERFQKFYFNTYPFERHVQDVVSGAANHYRKALCLEDIARELSPKLAEDNAELSQQGHTDAKRSKELSALIESIILELYSSLDCTRKVITKIYGDYKRYRGVKDSTHKLFNAMFEDKVDERVPCEIREAFKSASWYKELVMVRDKLVHSDIGSCHLGEGGKIFYMHPWAVDGKLTFIKEDIFQYIDTLKEQINGFNGVIFAYLNTTLKDEEVRQVCGIFGGLIYTRYVKPSDAIDFNSGRCNRWFDSPGKIRCPLADKCAAYSRT